MNLKPAALLLPSAILLAPSVAWSQEQASSDAPAEAEEKETEEKETEEKEAEEKEAEEKEAEEDKKKKRKLIIALDGEGSSHIYDGEEDVSLGGGASLRVGSHRSFLGILAYRPELGLGYTRLSGNNTGRVYAGGRFGLDFIVGAYAFAHAGVGWGAPDAGFMFDVGAAVDFILLSVVRPGLHVKYENIVGNMESVSLGLHVELAY